MQQGLNSNIFTNSKIAYMPKNKEKDPEKKAQRRTRLAKFGAWLGSATLSLLEIAKNLTGSAAKKSK